MHGRITDVGGFLRTGARELPSNAFWVWERARALGAEARSRMATLAASRGGTTSLDADDMTKDELMDLARREKVSGRSSMTKAQLAAALRKVRRS
jgi:hypothetical protein